MSAAQQFFDTHPVFTRDEFMDRGGGASSRRATIDALLAYHVRERHIRRLRRGLYQSTRGVADAPPEPLHVAARLAPDSVIALRSALAFHGLSHSVHRTATYLTTRAVRRWSSRGVTYIAVAPPIDPSTGVAIHMGVMEATFQALSVCVTTQERTVVDVLRDPRRAGGFDEVWNAIGAVRALDAGSLLAYLDALADGNAAARLGQWLELRDGVVDVDPGLLPELRRRRPETPIPLDAAAPRGADLFVTDWNVVLPRALSREPGAVAQ